MSDQPDPNVHLPQPAPDEPTYHMNFNVWNDDIMKKEGFGRLGKAFTTFFTHPLRFVSNLYTMKSDSDENAKIMDQMLKDGTYPPEVAKYKKILLSDYKTTNRQIWLHNPDLFKVLYDEETYNIIKDINSRYNSYYNNKMPHDEELQEEYDTINQFLDEKIELPPTADKKLLINSYIIPTKIYQRFKQEYGIPTVPGENTDTGHLA